jgi:hypothetical protein
MQAEISDRVVTLPAQAALAAQLAAKWNLLDWYDEVESNDYYHWLIRREQSRKDVRQGEGGRLAGLNPSLELNTKKQVRSRDENEFHQYSLRGQKILLLFIETALVLLWGDELLLGIYRQQSIPFMCYISAKAPDFYFAPSYTRCPHS